MTDVFISYSRKDKPFVQKLYKALRSQERETWVDWDAIEWTENWWQAIERGIEGTNTFVFVISPDSIESKHCRAEIDHAVKHNKRLVPVVYREVDAALVHDALGKLNWLFFRDADPFEATFAELIAAIEMDLEYVQAHTRLEVKAIEWETKDRNSSFLLRGDGLREAEAWLAASAQKVQQPTNRQRDYISASQTNEAIVRKAERRAKQLAWIGSGVLAVTLIGAGIATSWAVKETSDANTATKKAQETERKANQQVVKAQQRADAITQRADRQVEIAEAKLKAAEAKTAQAQKAVISAKAEQEQVLAQSQQQIREAERQTQVASEQAQVAEQRRQQADVAVKVAQVRLKEAEALQAEARAGTQIEQSAALALRRFEIDQTDGLLLAMRAGFDLQKLVKNKPLEAYPATSPILALQSGIARIREIKIPWNTMGFPLGVAFREGNIQVASRGENIKLLDKEGNLLKELSGTNGDSQSIGFSYDGKRIVTVSDGNVKLWNEDVALLGEFRIKQDEISGVALSHDATQVVTIGYDTIQLWNKDGRLLREFHSTQKDLRSVAFSADDTQIIIGNFDGIIQLWNKDGRLFKEFQSGQGRISGVAFSPDGTQLITVGNDIKVWNKDGELLKTFRSNEEESLIAVSLDGTQFATVYESGMGGVKLWSKEESFLREFAGNQGNITATTFSPNGKQIAIGDSFGNTKLWSWDGKLLDQLAVGPIGVVSIAFSPDGTRIAVGGAYGTKLWGKDVSPRELLDNRKIGSDSSDLVALLFGRNQAQIGGIVFSSDGTQIATVGEGRIKLWSMDGQPLKDLDGLDFAFNPDATQLAVLESGGKVKLWSRDGTVFKELPGDVASFAFSHDGTQIATVGRESIKLWSKDGTLLREFQIARSNVSNIIFSSDSKYIATFSRSGTTQVWSKNGFQVGQFEGGYPSQLSPDWKTIATTKVPIGSKIPVVRLYPIDLDLNSLLNRACLHLKPYLLNSPELKEDRDRCAAHLGETWNVEQRK